MSEPSAGRDACMKNANQIQVMPMKAAGIGRSSNGRPKGLREGSSGGAHPAHPGRSRSSSASPRAPSATTRSSACWAAAPARTRSAHRLCGDADIAHLRRVLRLRDLLGLSLESIVDLTAQAEEMRAALRSEWGRIRATPTGCASSPTPACRTDRAPCTTSVGTGTASSSGRRLGAGARGGAAAAAGRRGRARRRHRSPRPCGRRPARPRSGRRRSAAGRAARPARSCSTTAIHAASSCGARGGGASPGDAVGLLDEHALMPSERATPVAATRSRAAMPPPAP